MDDMQFAKYAVDIREILEKTELVWLSVIKWIKPSLLQSKIM